MNYHPIIDTPLAGDRVTGEGIPTDQFQSLLETIEQALNPKIYTVATVPAADINGGRLIPVSDESGGYTFAFSDGVDWRRIQDRAIIT